ncbi:MAG: PH domain-containing protein [Verrucomicrobia bacterium]|nr:PH domain-containing protein [Verrucomicrobiota bacterium]
MSTFNPSYQMQGTGSQFGAPLSTGVKVVTVAVLLLLVVLLVVLPALIPPSEWWAAVLAPSLLALILAVVALFCVRGFTVNQRELLIQRLFWPTRFSLTDLQRAYPDPEALRWSLRKAGNGGFLAYTGWFWSKRLGSFRAFVTDPARCVVLEFKHRKLVVSPDDPGRFVQTLGFNPESGRPQC